MKAHKFKRARHKVWSELQAMELDLWPGDTVEVVSDDAVFVMLGTGKVKRVW